MGVAHWMPVTVAVVGIVLSGFAARIVHEGQTGEFIATYEQDVDQQVSAVAERLVGMDLSLQAVKSLVLASDEVTPSEFSTFTSELFAGLPPEHAGRVLTREFGWFRWNGWGASAAIAARTDGKSFPTRLLDDGRRDIQAWAGRGLLASQTIVIPGHPFVHADTPGDPLGVTLLIPVFAEEGAGGTVTPDTFVFYTADLGGLAHRLTQLGPLATLDAIRFIPAGATATAASTAVAREPGPVTHRIPFGGGTFALTFRPSGPIGGAYPNAEALGIFAIGTILSLMICGYLVSVNRQNHVYRELTETAARNAEQKSRFFANMSHEIRTPISGIIGMARLIERSGVSEKQESYLRNLTASAESLLTIINEILDFSKAESEKLTLSPEIINAEEVVRMATFQFEQQARDKGLSLVVDYPRRVARWVEADPLRVRQILTNLIGNAVKFTDRGKITVRVSDRASDSDGMVTLVFEVEDTGIGIPGHRLPDIFESFTQGDISTTKRYGGTGLGLAICKQLVALMDGQITVESAEGLGTVFTFSLTLPLVRQAAGETARRKGARSADRPVLRSDDAPALSSIRVLLVEDDATNQIYAQSVLEDAGCSVTVAHDGREAVEIVSKNRFDLILMDCQMPVMDGFSATRHIKEMMADGRAAPCRIVALTANALNGDSERCYDAGMDGYIAKPLDEGRIDRLVHDIRASRTGRQAAPARVRAAATVEPAAPPESRQHPGEGAAHNAPPPPRRQPRSAPSEPVTEPPVSAATPKAEDGLIDDAALVAVKARMGDKFPRVIDAFIEDMDRHMEEAEQAIRDAELGNAVRPFHTMKSSSKLLGAMALQMRAAQLENMAKVAPEGESPSAEFTGASQDLRRAYEATKSHLQKVRG